MRDSTDSIIELMKQKFRAKCRFRALVRYAISNLYWLKEGVPILKAVSAATSEQYVEPVKKSKLAKKINFTDKVLLNKPAEDRTIEENRYLNRLIGNLKCFRRYPNPSIREGCISAKLLCFKPGDTIYGDGKGFKTYAYFVISGRCQMIESLRIGKMKIDGQTVYGLYDNVSEPEVETKEQEINFDKYFQRYEGKLAKSSESSSSAGSTKNNQPDFVKKYNTYVHKEDEELICLRSPHISYEKLLKTSFRVSVLPEDLHREPRDMKTYFMQVCQFTTGASFGFGENMRDRRIVALTETRCLLLPLVYLYQRNTAGIWTRIRHYLDRKIPNKEKLFDDFFLEVEWSEFKEPIIEDIVARRSAVNHTTIHDVPYAIRMEELVEF